MGCGASAKKDVKTDDVSSVVSTEPTKVAEEETTVMDQVETAAITGALDIVGAVGTIGGAALSTIGHGTAAALLTVADCATLGMIDSIGDTRDEHFEEMRDGRDDVAAGFQCHTHTEFYRGEPCCDKSTWMARIPDSTNVTSMFIPGTHDTMADSGGDLAECQSWSLKQQLESGIRVLDLRFKHDADFMKCFHGIIDLHKDDIHDTIPVLESFLMENPTEAIFARIKREGQCSDHSCDFHDQLIKDITKPELWNLRAQIFGPLSEFRGKVTLLSFGSPIKLPRQAIAVQDKYNTGDEDEKFNAIMSHAAEQRPIDTLQISFCSAVGADGWTCFKAPGAMAYQVNKKVLDASDKLTPGMYLFDFPGNALIDAFMQHNSKFVPK
mmetsp:Transcript_36477/g.58045  ORF Transcript_36477/g.58045 Transcript_36477/m.58045 type:complete len:382 (-) Transcript_36477:89-1234(-)